MLGRLLSPTTAVLMIFWWAGDGVAALPSYFFADFEDARVWPAGPLKADSPAGVAQGSASVEPLASPDSGRALVLAAGEPFSAVVVHPGFRQESPHSWCELLVRPFAIPQEHDEEFLDFGSAALSFVRVGDKGELRALTGKSETESLWITAGAQFELASDGVSAEWLKLTIHIDHKAGRWELWANDQALLSGLRTNRPNTEPLALWLYSHASRPVIYDEILLATIAPDQLRQLHAAQLAKPRPPRQARLSRAPQTVVKTKPLNSARQEDAGLRESYAAIAPTLRDWDLTLSTGERAYKKGTPTEIEGRQLAVTPFQREYDGEGRIKPGKLTVTADAELKPGVDLSQLRWQVERVTDLRKPGQVLVSGHFGTGLIQTVPVQGKWMTSALLVSVYVSPADGGEPDSPALRP